MSETQHTKRCSKCKQEKPVSDFYRDKRSTDGLYCQCKECHSKAVYKYADTGAGKLAAKKAKANSYLRHGEEMRAASREWHKSSRGREWCREYRNRHPGEVRARMAVNNAVNQGKIPRPDSLLCHKCHCPADHYHHYLGYTKKHWFDIVPMCRHCHAVVHKSC